MSYVGDIRLGDTIDVKFATVGTTGAPTTLAGSPVISAYPGNSTTEITAGITLTVDFDTRTGMHNCRVVASNGNGYATATNYALVITTGTVGGTSVVGYVIGEFSIENRSALMPTTAARTLVVDAAGLADANGVKLGPTGAGTAQTARDIGASVLLSVGTGTGQVNLSSGRVPIRDAFEKNTARAGFQFPMTDSTTHAPKTGVTVTAQRSIDGGAFASCTNSATEIGNGAYTIDLSAADLNGNFIMLRFTGSSADDQLIGIATYT